MAPNLAKGADPFLDNESCGGDPSDNDDEGVVPPGGIVPPHF